MDISERMLFSTLVAGANIEIRSPLSDAVLRRREMLSSASEVCIGILLILSISESSLARMFAR